MMRLGYSRRAHNVLFVSLLIAITTVGALSVSAADQQKPGGAVAAPGAASNQAQIERVLQEKQKLERDIQAANLEMHKADQKSAAEQRAKYQQLLQKYREVCATEIVVRSANVPSGAQAQIVGTVAPPEERYKKVKKDAFAFVETHAEDKKGAYSALESTLDTLRIQREVAEEAGRRLNPLYDNRVGRPGEYFHRGEPKVNATVWRLHDLLKKIIENNVEEPRLPSFLLEGRKPTQVEREVEEWLRRKERDGDIQEYFRIAEGGVIVDPETGKVITGHLRDRIGKNAKLQLVEALRAKGMEPTLIGGLFGWNDSRRDIAAQIEEEVRSNDWYRVLDFLNPSTSGASMTDVFRAMALVVRRSEDTVHEWRSGVIPEGGNGGIGGWLYEQFWAKQKVGAGTGWRISGYDKGKGTLKEVDDRIDEYDRQCDAVIAAFTAAAATPDPKKLDPDAHKLLEAYGFIVKNAKGEESYRIPTQATQAMQKDLNLPGAPLMDIISGFNVMKTVILIAAPEIAAGNVGALVNGLEVGSFVIRVTETGTQILVNAAGTAIDQKLTTGTVEWDRIALDAVAMTPATSIVGEATGAFTQRLAAVLKDKKKREMAQFGLSQMLGLSGDSALMAYWEANVKNTNVSYEDFLANVINGALGRIAPSVGRMGAQALDPVAQQVWKRMPRPEWAKKIIGGDPELTRIDAERQAKLESVMIDIQRRLADVVGNKVFNGKQLASDENVAKIDRALRSGKLSIKELRMLYTGMGVPGYFEPMLVKVLVYRKAFAEQTLEIARKQATKKVQELYKAKIEEAQKIQDPDRRAKTVEELQAALKEAEKDIAAPLKKQGSENVTSDIDRTVGKSALRNELKAVEDMLLGGGVDAPTTARVYDLNDYVDVFRIINRQKQDVREVTFTDSSGNSMKQADAAEAASIAAAMMLMTPAERAQYEKKLTHLRRDDPKLAQKLKYAKESLARGEQELMAKIAELEKSGYKEGPDRVVRARDILYGERVQKLEEMEAAYAKMKPDSPEAKALAAQIQREWNYTLREGIEAYSDFTGLDIIVQRGQMQDISIRSLIKDSSKIPFVSKQEATGMINDQIGMMVEHVNAFHEGLESPADTGSALAKYAERAILGFKLRGDNIAEGDMGELNAICEKLMAVRKNSAKLAEELANFYKPGTGGDKDNTVAGLRKLIALIAKAIPETEGIFDPEKPKGAAPSLLVEEGSGGAVRAGLAMLARRRERMRERGEFGFGDEGVLQAIVEELTSMESELAELKERQQLEAYMTGLYRRQDWDLVAKLLDARRAVSLQQKSLPNEGGALAAALAAQEKAYSEQLELLRKEKKMSGDREVPSADEERRTKRIAVLEKEIEESKAELARLNEATRKQEELAREELAKGDDSGESTAKVEITDYTQTAKSTEPPANPEPSTQAPVIPKLVLTPAGILFPTDWQFGEMIFVSLTTSPGNYSNIPGLMTVPVTVPLPVDEKGAPSKAGVQVDIGDGKVQPLNAPISFVPLPKMVEVPLAFVHPSQTVPIAKEKINLPPVPPTPPIAQDKYSTPAIYSEGGVQVIHGPLTGKPAQIAVDGVPATVVAGNPRSVFWHMPQDIKPGRHRVVVSDGGTPLTAFPITMIGLRMSADRLHLLKGESTEFRATIVGAESLPAEAWRGGMEPDLIDNTWLKKVASQLPLPGADKPGVILLHIVNKSQDTVQMSGAKDGSITLILKRQDFANGPYTFTGKLKSIRAGTFNIEATMVPLLAPIDGEGVDAGIRNVSSGK